MDNTVKRYIQYVEVTGNDAVVVLDDGSVLGGVFSVQATTTAPVEGEEETPSQSFANILAYILHENVTFNDIQIADKTQH
jgi:hypothetical protein